MHMLIDFFIFIYLFIFLFLLALQGKQNKYSKDVNDMKFNDYRLTLYAVYS